MFENKQVPEGIKTFGSAQEAEQARPEERIFILTSEELHHIILKASEPLLARIKDLEDRSFQLAKKVSDLEATQDTLGDNQLIQLRIIKEIKDKAGDPGETELERCQKIMRYLKARPDHRATMEALRGVLGVNESLLSQTIKVLKEMNPGRYATRRIKGERDGRKKELIEIRNILI